MIISILLKEITIKVTMEIIDVVSYLALAILIYGIVMFFVRPIARDRILAQGVRTTIVIMISIIFVVPFAINGIVGILGIEAGDLVGGQNGFHTDNLFLSILYHFTDPGNLQEANNNGLIVAWVCALLGIFLFAGLMVSTIVSILDQRANLWRKGLLRYNRNFRGYFRVIIVDEFIVRIFSKE